MTRKEAIEVLKAPTIQKLSFEKVVVDGKALSVKVALRMAINALEQETTGHWIYDEEFNVYRCSRCNYFPWRVLYVKEGDEIFTDLTRTNAYRYCPNCGIPMESEE